jgi:hypothetical protein
MAERRGYLMVRRGTVAVVCMMLAAGCSGGAHQTTLAQNWIYTSSDGTRGVALDLTSDGTYVFAILALTSSTSAEAEVEYGTYTAANDVLSLTPEQFSCSASDPPYQVGYSFQNGNLLLSISTGAIVMQPNPDTVDQSFTLQFGCFSSAGAFSAMPVQAVTN